MVSVKAVARVGAHELAVRRLHCVCPERCDSGRVHVYPLVPSSPPAIVMHIHLVRVYIYDLCFESLIYRVLDVYSLAYVQPSFAEIEPRGIFLVVGKFRQSLEV